MDEYKRYTQFKLGAIQSCNMHLIKLVWDKNASMERINNFIELIRDDKKREEMFVEIYREKLDKIMKTMK